MPRHLPYLLVPLLFAASAARADFAADYGTLLARGHTTDAAALAEARLADAPADDQALFALGAAQFLGAVEGLGQGLYRFGVNNGEGSGLAADMPFLRLPVARNPAPEPVSYEGLRGVLADFVDDLAIAEATLARVSDAPVKLPVALGAIRLDFDGDGKGAAHERLVLALATIAGVDAPPEDFTIHFDESDVPWLRGYAHLLSAIAEIPLAHDWREAFEQTFHGAFPSGNLPSSGLQREYERLQARLRAMDVPEEFHWGPNTSYEDYQAWQNGPEGQARAAFEASEAYRESHRLDSILWMAGFADALAFVHLIDWPVVESARLSSSRQHLLSMIALSRESWTRIAAETDDDREWVPGPKQTSPFPTMRVAEERVQGWHAFLDGFEAVLEGRLLLPHWRFGLDRGLNIRRLMEEPRRLDLLMLIHGTGALPYIEEGSVAAGSTLDTAAVMVMDGFLAYFIWFN